MKIIAHRLHHAGGTPLPFRASPNVGALLLNPQYLVMHYTAGSTAEESIGWLCSAESKASAHLVIGRDGSITQLVPFNRVAWHAGESAWQGRVGLNAHSIGIELSNHGFLGSARPGEWKFRGQPVPDGEVLVDTHAAGTPHGGWHRYTDRQLTAARLVARLLVNTYCLMDLLGHDEISPGRKVDPGPAFPMADFRAAVFGSPLAAAPRLGVPDVALAGPR